MIIQKLLDQTDPLGRKHEGRCYQQTDLDIFQSSNQDGPGEDSPRDKY